MYHSWRGYQWFECSRKAALVILQEMSMPCWVHVAVERRRIGWSGSYSWWGWCIQCALSTRAPCLNVAKGVQGSLCAWRSVSALLEATLEVPSIEVPKAPVSGQRLKPEAPVIPSSCRPGGPESSTTALCRRQGICWFQSPWGGQPVSPWALPADALEACAACVGPGKPHKGV